MTDTTHADTLERARDSGMIRVGIANEAPFAYADDNGKLAGEAPDIARHVLGELGIPKMVGVIVNFGDLIGALEDGRIDMIAAGMFVNPGRCEKVLFSEPTYGIGQALLVKAGNPAGLMTYETIAASRDAVIGVMTGAAEKDYAIASDIPEDRIRSYASPAGGLRAVQSGDVDAFALTALSIRNLVTKAGPKAGVDMTRPFGVVAGKSVTGHGAFAFRKDDQNLRDAFNGVLQTFIGGKPHLDMVRPYGFGADEVPTVTTKTLCQGG